MFVLVREPDDIMLFKSACGAFDYLHSLGMTEDIDFADLVTMREEEKILIETGDSLTPKTVLHYIRELE